jgi:hypothetical protein
VIRYHFKRKRASLATALCDGSCGGRAATHLRPDRNPIKPLCAQPGRAAVVQPQGGGAGNLVGDTLDDVIAAADHGIQRIRHAHHLAFSFLCYCGLSPMVSNDHVTGTSDLFYRNAFLYRSTL